MFCPHCGATNADNATFCGSCGRPTSTPGGLGASMGPAAPFVPPASVDVRIGDWIGKAWNLVTSDLMLFVGATVVFLVLASVVPVLLNGALAAGIHIICINKIRRGKSELGDLFKGFNYFVPTLVANLLISVFIFLGMIACLIPALVVAAIYVFPYLFIVDRKMEFWPAMEASHAIVKKNYVGFVLLVLSFAGLHIVGALACLVGLLVTIPMQYAAITIAYQELVGFATPEDTPL